VGNFGVQKEIIVQRTAVDGGGVERDPSGSGYRPPFGRYVGGGQSNHVAGHLWQAHVVLIHGIRVGVGTAELQLVVDVVAHGRFGTAHARPAVELLVRPRGVVVDDEVFDLLGGVDVVGNQRAVQDLLLNADVEALAGLG